MNVCCMLDMCDLHDFLLQRLGPPFVSHTHTHTYRYLMILEHTGKHGNGHSEKEGWRVCSNVTYATHECRVDSYWRMCSSYHRRRMEREREREEEEGLDINSVSD